MSFLWSRGPRGQEHLVHVRKEWRWVDGRRMHARVSTEPVPEDRLPVVLVHGLAVSSRYLVPTIERLGRDFRVFAPDLPGFGRSDRPDHILTIRELADALASWMSAAGLDRAALLGNSLGCQIAIEFALRNPERVACLILQGPTPDPRARDFPRSLLRLAIDATRENIGLAPIVDYLLVDKIRAIRTAQFLLRDPFDEKLPKVRVPTLVVAGSQDPVTPADWAAEVARLLPEGRLIVVPGAAHTMVTANALELTRVVRPFLLEMGQKRSRQQGAAR